MPTTTWTLAKGIPPRIRSPPCKGGGKKAAQPKTAPKHHKRHASESGNEECLSDDTPESHSEKPKPKQKGKKHAKRHCTKEPEEEDDDDEVEEVEEVEEVDGAEPKPEVEEVDDLTLSGINKVSNIPDWSGMDLHNARRMGSMIINMAETSENSQWKRSQHVIYSL